MSSLSNLELITDALRNYTQQTGIDLSKNPFFEKFQFLTSPGDILGLLQEREKTFKEFRDQNRTLISCLTPAVQVIHVFSDIVGEAVRLVPFPPATAVFVGIDVLLAATNGVTSSYDSLLDLFECLGSFLKRLEIYTSLPPTPAMTDIVVKILVELLRVLALATKQIKQGRFKKFAKKLLGESEVEAVLQRLDQLTQDEARMTVAQTFGVVHGLVNNMRVVIDDGKWSMDGIRQTLVVLHGMVIDINKMKREQLQRDVQHWLSPPDPSTNHDLVWESHQKGTGVWFFESNVLAEWKLRGSILWIHGKPGSGKSTLLSAIIQDVEDMRAAGLVTMAYFYFDFRDIKKQNRYGLLSSLVSQLSAKSDSCYEVLSRLYSDNASGTGKPTSSALAKCLKDMLSRPGQGRMYIIIDALDECPDSSGTPSAREQVLELIEDLVDLGLPNVHLCVTSRPEIDIGAVLGPLTSLQISLHDENGQKKDIIEYIKSVVHSDRRMRKWKDQVKQLIIDLLSDKADGMFRWVVCQIDRLRRSFPGSIQRILNDLPESLDETYCRMLLGIDGEKREYAQRLFRCLTVSIRPLRVDELAEIFAFQFDQTPPIFIPDWRPVDASEAVLSACSSLIAIVNVAGSQVVQFSHFSVKEFLTSSRLADAEERLSYYHVLPEPAHMTLACASLSVLLQLDYAIDRTTIRDFPLAQYAARYWIDHAQFRDVSLHIQDTMIHLFDLEQPHFGAWVWLFDVDRHWVDPMSEIHPTRPEAVPLYYASLCGFLGLAEQLVISHPMQINARGGSYGTPLHAASWMGHLQVAKLLLTNNADLNSRDDEGWTPLHTALRYGHLEVVGVLLDQGIDINAKDEDGWSPLHFASSYERSEIARLLIQRGAVVDILGNDQESPLDIAAASGSVEIVRLLLKSGANVDPSDKYGCTPLHSAACEGHHESAQLLLESGASLDSRNNIRWTPLFMACRYGRLEVSRLLIDNGSDVNLSADDGWTPLHLASANGHLDVTELLVQHGAIIDSRNDIAETPLDRASRNGHLEIVRLLLERGAAMFSRDVNGWTPFHTASYSGHLRVVRFLLEYGVDVDIRNENEETSLDLASGSGELDTVRFLMEKGADIHTRDKNGWNPLHIASQNGHLDIVRLLIDSGTTIDIRNGTQRTPLALASLKGKVEVSLFLIDRGANVNVQDNEGWAPLHFASRYGHTDLARLLLDRGVDLNIQKASLWSPLHLSSANGHLEVTRLLVERGARIDIFNDEQESPLDRAADNGQVEIVRLLIDHGANLHSEDSYGWTPLHTASRSGHLEVVKLLLRRGADVSMLNKARKTATDLAVENDKADVASFLAEYKADANVRNKVRSSTMDTAQHDAGGDEKPEGKASLHTASEEGNVDLVKSLLEQGVDVNAQNTNYETPLHRAAIKGNVSVARLLIKGGAQVDSRDKYGVTPLHKASRRGHVEVSRVLIDQGANVNARDLDHWTPMHFSAKFGKLEVVELLLEHDVDVHVLNNEGQTPYRQSLRKGYTKISDLLRRHGGT